MQRQESLVDRQNPRTQGSIDEEISRLDRLIATGDLDAMFHRALMHQKGEGSPIDHRKARELYLDAAILNHASALNNLACMFRFGLGTNVNPANAHRYFTLASQRGSQVATSNLKLMEQNFASTKKLAMLESIVGNKEYWSSHKTSPSITRIYNTLIDQNKSQLEKAVYIWIVANNRYDPKKISVGLDDLLYKAITEDDIAQLLKIENQVFKRPNEEMTLLELFRDIVSDRKFWEKRNNPKMIKKINKMLVVDMPRSEKLAEIKKIADRHKPNPKFYSRSLQEDAAIFVKAILNEDFDKLRKLEEDIASERRARSVVTLGKDQVFCDSKFEL